MFINMNLANLFPLFVQHEVTRLNEVITQSDVQLVQEDFCKFMVREVLNPKGLFYDHDSEYATHPKFESLRLKCLCPFFSFFVHEHN
jgi:hypothetical protein